MNREAKRKEKEKKDQEQKTNVWINIFKKQNQTKP